MAHTIVYVKPELYDSSNKLHLRDAKEALDKYSHLLRCKEGERVLDVGCGTGNVTTNVLAPYLAPDYKLLVSQSLCVCVCVCCLLYTSHPYSIISL